MLGSRRRDARRWTIAAGSVLLAGGIAGMGYQALKLRSQRTPQGAIQAAGLLEDEELEHPEFWVYS